MSETNILDRLGEIKKIDRNDMVGLCMKTPQYCRDAVERAKRIRTPEQLKPRNIVIAGVGGSAIGGELLRDWLSYRISLPIEICRDYVLPVYANKNTLVYVVTYSGETEETLSAFVDAVKKKCVVFAITSGGHLLSFSKKLQVPHVLAPSGLPSRAALPYLFLPSAIIMEKLSVVSNAENEIQEAVRTAEKVLRENSPQIPMRNNLAKNLAWNLRRTVPVVYGFRQYCSVAHRWKTQFDENSKIVNKYDVFPELDHNEVMGWQASEKFTKQFSVVLIRDREEPPEIKQRIEATKSFALHRAREVLEVFSEGKGRLAKMLSIICLGDLVSVYLAILRGVDPTPVRTITDIKTEMKKKLNVVKKLEAEVEKLV
ncbi:MAG: bifunctional phosphoglucose/phosphomannose isomerase [Thermoproteota archaeon]|nr:bifunctional phosphoglucose/phosphomannose isomerase [Thermoproteota archaeon]